MHLKISTTKAMNKVSSKRETKKMANPPFKPRLKARWIKAQALKCDVVTPYKKSGMVIWSYYMHLQIKKLHAIVTDIDRHVLEG